MRRATAALAIAVLAALLGGGGPAAAAAARSEGDAAGARRVLVLSLPHLAWEDLQRHDLPNLESLLAGAAIADLSAKAVEHRTALPDGYVTLGAGARAVGPTPATNQAFDASEEVGSQTAAAAFLQQTGEEVAGGVVHLGVEPIVEANASLRYDAEVGALGSALRAHGWTTAVVANADHDELGRAMLDRAAAAGVTDRTGRIDAGRVSAALLVPDPDAPFGVRLDDGAVVEAFEAAWRDRAAVLVEASDLVRFDEFRGVATPEQEERLFARTLARTDALVGALLASVDLRRDAVLVVSPAHRAAAVTATVTALAGPGVEPGFARSATTRRSGFVQLVDVAPTVLAVAGAPRPAAMEGRPFTVDARGDTYGARVELLAAADEAARLRDSLVGAAAVVLLAGALAVAAALALFLAYPSRGRARLATLLARAALSLVPALLLAQAGPVARGGAIGFWVFVAAVTAGLAALWWRASRSDPLGALLAALGFLVGLLLLDAVLGSPLQFNSVIGFSPTSAGRFTGFGNTAYAALGAATLVLGGLLAHRVGGRRGAAVAVGLFGVVVLVDGAPMWGADVGGVLSLVPSFGITAVLLFGYRLRPRTLAALAGVTVAAVSVMGLVDLARPASSRTHLGRLVETLTDRGWAGVWTIIQRKAEASTGTVAQAPALLWILPVAAALLALVLWRYRALPRVVEAVPALRASAIGFAALAVLGFALNDSGLAVPSMMCFVGIAALAELAVATTPRVPGSRRAALERADTRG